MNDVLMMSPDTCPDCKEGDTLSVKLGPITTLGDGTMICEVSSAETEGGEEEAAGGPEEGAGEGTMPPEETPSKKGGNALVMAVMGRKK